MNVGDNNTCFTTQQMFITTTCIKQPPVQSATLNTAGSQTFTSQSKLTTKPIMTTVMSFPSTTSPYLVTSGNPLQFLSPTSMTSSVAIASSGNSLQFLNPSYMATNAGNVISGNILQTQNPSSVQGVPGNTYPQNEISPAMSKCISLCVKQAVKDTMNEMGLLLLRDDVQSIKHDVETLKSSVNFSVDSNTELMNSTKKVDSKVKGLEQRVELLQSQLVKERENRLRLEVETRKCNLKILGLADPGSTPESFEELLESLNKIFEHKLGFRCTMSNAYRLGKSPSKSEKQQRPRPVLVSFPDQSARDKIWRSRKNLAGSDLYVKEDLPFEIEQMVNKIMPCYIAAKKRGMSAHIKYDALFISGVKYTTSSLHQLPEGIRPSDLCSKENRNCVLFWGRDSPLSNFYTSQDLFSEGNYSFSSSEQYLQAAKARLFEDDDALLNIMSLSDPVQIKRTRINNFDDKIWK